MASLSENANILVKKYKDKYNEYPRGWAHGEETMKEYEEYLQKELEKNK